MEGKEQAKKLFIKSIVNETNLDAETQKQIARSVQKLIRESLSKLPKGSRFHFVEFWVVIQKTAEKGRLIPEKAAEAFEILEKYFILIYKAPWKKEFRKLKTYGGFFQSKAKAHLEDPESILCLVGFQPEGSGTLALRGEMDSNLLLSVAFECVVASVECEMISEFHRKMKESGALVIDVVRWRDTGELPDVRKRSSREPLKNVTLDSAYSSSSHGYSTKPSVLGAEGGYGRNLPFIDEDDNIVPNDTGYVEGTIDEHYMASLKQLSQSESTQEKYSSQKAASDDWSYVTNTLKTKYGKGYFDGPRGDVIRNANQNIRVRHNDELSDEGIDIGEEPPAVNIQPHPIRIEHQLPRSMVSHDRSRESGYRTASSSQVHYPPAEFGAGNLYPGVQSSTNSAYMSHSSGRSQPPIVARGIERTSDSGYPNNDRMARSPHIYDNNDRSAQHASRTTADLMSRNMQHLGLDAEWACAFCTFRNDRNAPICSGCGKSKDQGSEVDGPQCGDRITVCKTCTLENEPGDIVCSACGNELDKANVHTFV